VLIIDWQYNVAISQHRNAARDLSPANVEAVCLSTVLISSPAFILLQSTEVGSYTPLISFFQLQTSSVDLFVQALPLLLLSSDVNSIMRAKANISEFLIECRKEIYRALFEHTLREEALDESIDAEPQEAYTFAMGLIGAVLAVIEEGRHDAH